jgi:hypothetical protein
MDEYKLKHFARQNPGKRLPIVSSTEDEVAATRTLLLHRLGLPQATDGLSLVQAIASRSVPLEGLDASRPDFALSHVLQGSLAIHPEEELFLNWRRFDHLDRIQAGELARHFDDVWYPGTDDLDILDAQCRLILSIAHHGGVRLLRFGQCAPEHGFSSRPAKGVW